MSGVSKPNLTAGTYLVEAPCPRCGALEEILGAITTALSTPLDGIPSLKVKLVSKPREHDCGQRRIPDTPLGVDKEEADQ